MTVCQHDSKIGEAAAKLEDGLTDLKYAISNVVDSAGEYEHVQPDTRRRLRAIIADHELNAALDATVYVMQMALKKVYEQCDRLHCLTDSRPAGN